MGIFSSESKNQTQVDPMRRDQVVDWQNRWYGLLDQPFQFYPEQRYAGLQPLQEEALGMQEEYARGLGGMVDPSMSAWQSMLSAPDAANNPFVQAMIGEQANVLNRNLTENLLPAIQSGAIGAGQLGGSREGVASGIAMRGTQDALARAAAQTQLDAYGKGLAQQQYGLGATPSMVGLGQIPAQMLAGIGDIRRGEAQREIDEDIARFEFEQREPWDRMSQWVSPYQSMSQPYTTTTAESQYKPSAMQVGGQLVGMVSSLMGAFNPMGGGGGGGGGNPWAAQTNAMPAPATPSYGGYSSSNFMPMSSYGFRGLGPYGGM